MFLTVYGTKEVFKLLISAFIFDKQSTEATFTGWNSSYSLLVGQRQGITPSDK